MLGTEAAGRLFITAAEMVRSVPEGALPQLTMLATVGGLSIAAAAVGLTLGRSTVAEINPAYMQDPEVPFYSDVVPGQRPRADWAQVQAQEYQAEAQAPPPAGCVGCTWPVDPTPREDPAIAAFDRPRTVVAPRERADAPVRITIVEQPAQRDWSRVTRYANYPVDRYGDRVQEDDGGDEGDAGTQ